MCVQEEESKDEEVPGPATVEEQSLLYWSAGGRGWTVGLRGMEGWRIKSDMCTVFRKPGVETGRGCGCWRDSEDSLSEVSGEEEKAQRKSTAGFICGRVLLDRFSTR